MIDTTPARRPLFVPMEERWLAIWYGVFGHTLGPSVTA